VWLMVIPVTAHSSHRLTMSGFKGVLCPHLVRAWL